MFLLSPQPHLLNGGLESAGGSGSYSVNSVSGSVSPAPVANTNNSNSTNAAANSTTNNGGGGSAAAALAGGEGLVTIRITPDERGRFGFNVKGGYDQSLPIIVSRVGANMPADICIPRLHEGDQVLFINGRDVSTHTHEQVVQFIRAAAENSGELVLVVRPSGECALFKSASPSSRFTPNQRKPSSKVLFHSFH